MTSNGPTGGASTLGRADRLQPALLVGSIAVGLGLGRAVPGFADHLGAGVAVGVFALITVVLLQVDPVGVRRAFGERRFLVAAVVLNFVVNPALAWGLAELLLGDRPALATGLILFLVTPCIGWFLVFTGLARGDTTLGVSLLGVNVVLQVLLLPGYLAVLAGASSAVPVGTLARSVAVFLVGPGLLVVALRRLLRSGEGVMPRWLQPVLLGFVIVAMFASEADAVTGNLDVVARVAVPMVVFFAVAFGLSLVVARGLRLPYPQTALLAFTTTSRNSEASLAIAATAFTDPLVGLVVVLGPVIELPLLVVMVRLLGPLGGRASAEGRVAQPAGV